MKKLPWTYWPIMLAALLTVMVLAAVIAATLGLNPYVAGSVAGIALTLYETYQLRRDPS